jgi:hypothetical protein
MTYWLFFISFCASVFTDNFIWVCLNGALIFTSYWSDKASSLEVQFNDTRKMLDEIDYFCIFMIALCYLNDVTTNTILLCAAGYEGYSKKTIDTIKNVAFAIAVIKCGVLCFSLNILIALNLVLFSLIGICVFRTRRVYFEKWQDKRDVLVYNLLTLGWRICALVILLTGTYTMEQIANFLKKPPEL